MAMIFCHQRGNDVHVVHRSPPTHPSSQDTFFKKGNILLITDNVLDNFKEESEKFIERLEKKIPEIVSQKNFAQEHISDCEPIFEAIECIKYGQESYIVIMIGPNLFIHWKGNEINSHYHSLESLGLIIVGAYKDKFRDPNKLYTYTLDKLFLNEIEKGNDTATALLQLSMLRDPEEDHSSVWLHSYIPESNEIKTRSFLPNPTLTI